MTRTEFWVLALLIINLFTSIFVLANLYEVKMIPREVHIHAG